MNFKKYIKLKEEDALSAEDREKYEELYRQVRFNQNTVAKRPVKQALITVAVFIVVALAVILTWLYLSNKPGDIVYSEENITSVDTSFGELKNDLKIIDLNLQETEIGQVNLTYDIKSNHKLYYSLRVKNELNMIDLSVVINQNYNYKFEIKDEVIKELNNYTIIFSSQNLRGTVPGILFSGYIKVQNETVFFEYTQIPALGDEAFFESIQQIIQVKQ